MNPFFWLTSIWFKIRTAQYNAVSVQSNVSSKRQRGKKSYRYYTNLVNVMLIGLSYSQQPQTIHTVFEAPAVRTFFTKKGSKLLRKGLNVA